MKENFIQISEIYKLESFMTSLTVVQIQINFDQTLDFVKTGKHPSITDYRQPIAMLFSSKDGTKLTRQRHTARLDGLLS